MPKKDWIDKAAASGDWSIASQKAAAAKMRAACDYGDPAIADAKPHRVAGARSRAAEHKQAAEATADHASPILG